MDIAEVQNKGEVTYSVTSSLDDFETNGDSKPQ